MIAFKSVGGMNTEIVPVFVCGICGLAIEDIGLGAVLFQGRGSGEGELLDLNYVHKGQCDNIAQNVLYQGKPGPCHELADHLIELVAGSKQNVFDIIWNQIKWTGLDPELKSELCCQLEELEEWLDEHAGSSPLWGWTVEFRDVIQP